MEKICDNDNSVISYIVVVGFLIAMFAFLISIGGVNAATSDTKTTPSNVTINQWVEISLSTELGNGVLFGTLDPDTTDNDATQNNETSGETYYYVEAGAANNVNIDNCIKNDQSLTKGSDTIDNGNYTYNWTATTDDSVPGHSNTSITTAYVKTQHTDIAAGAKSYSRFWLDVPAEQSAGIYNNTISIKGIQTGQSC